MNVGTVTAEEYRKYRGKCKEMSEELVKQDPTLKLVRGHYHCPFLRAPEPHWWCVKPDGTIVDPTKAQFASKGMGEYVEYDGTVVCDQCGKVGKEPEGGMTMKADEDAGWHLGGNGNRVFCSHLCHGRFIGVYPYEGESEEEFRRAMGG